MLIYIKSFETHLSSFSVKSLGYFWKVKQIDSNNHTFNVHSVTERECYSFCYVSDIVEDSQSSSAVNFCQKYTADRERFEKIAFL